MQHRPRSLQAWIAIAVAIAFQLPLAGSSRADDALSDLRRQIEDMKREYTDRIRALEKRVERAEFDAHDAKRQAADAERVASTPGPSARSRSANTFNPAISAILQGRYANYSAADGDRAIAGFLLGEETGLGPEGFSLGESEVDFSANVDDRFYGFLDVAFNQESGESSLEIEEAYFQTLALPEGFTLRGGQFFSAIGYQNARHSHTWDFVDQPLAYEVLLNNQFLDPGLRISWVAPTDRYLELGGELFSGDRFPASGGAHDGVGVTTLFAKASGDIGDSSSWKAGLAYLMADPQDRETGEGDGSSLFFNGSSDLFIADLVWKWAPQGNFRDRNLTLQTEYLRRRESGSLRRESASGTSAGDYDGSQQGFYVQGAYQFIPRWRIGLRYGQLFSSNDVNGIPGTTLADDQDSPWRVSAMLDFSNSEFSRLRLQYSHEDSGLRNDDAVFVQYIMSLGSHGAHQF